MRKKYTNDELLNELKRFYNENGKVPSVQDFNNGKTYPDPTTYIRHFGTWNNALKCVEFAPYKTYTNIELLNELQRFYKETDTIPMGKDFENDKNLPSYSTYFYHFGSWENALELAGLAEVDVYTNEFLLRELKRFVEENDKVPTTNDFTNNKDFPSCARYTKHFGSWNTALELAGLSINHVQPKLTGHEICYICKTPSTSHWCYINNKRLCNKCYCGNRRYLHGTLDPNSTTGMGVITEHIVSEVLGDCEKCNTEDDFCSDYDLVSNKYGNINVKSSTLRKCNNRNSYNWGFRTHMNSKIPNNYVCIGFNKNKSEILKVWIIDENSKLMDRGGIHITNSSRGLKRAKQYEVDPTPYNEIYQNLDITTLPEFRNWNFDNSLETEVI